MQMRDRVQFQSRVPLDDGYGNVTDGFDDKGTPLWCNFRETLGKERVEAGRVQASNTGTLRLRDSSASRAITEADVALIRGQAWNIRSIVPVMDRGAYIEMLLEGGVAT